MKKISTAAVMICVLLTGCQSDTKIKPFEVYTGNQLFSYYDTEQKIPETFSIVNNYREFSYNDDNAVLINENDEIRAIKITDDSVTTYESLSVGDSAKKIEQTFKYEVEVTSGYYVTVYNKFPYTEIDLESSDNLPDDLVYIDYRTDDDKITEIRIYDREFATLGR